MRAVIKAEGELGRLPIAGVSSRQRMSHALASLEGVGVIEGVPQRLEAGPLLWIEGWFPLLRAEGLHEFLAFARKYEQAIYFVEPGLGLHYVRSFQGSPSPDFFTSGLHRSARFHTEDPQFLSLAKAPDLGKINRLAFDFEAARVSAAGAFLMAPELTFIEQSVRVEAGAMIGPMVQLRGTTTVASGARIEQGCCLTDTVVGTNVHIKPYSVLEEARVEEAASVGPFAHIRPGSVLGPEVRVGNFVETKKVRLGKGSKASHLSYLGDAVIGEDCNIGAGTITCNYDGYNKSLTTLGDRVFIGSDSQLVAPVTVADDGYVAAGSCITKDVPANALGIARGRQVNKEGLAKEIREKARRKKAAAGK